MLPPPLVLAFLAAIGAAPLAPDGDPPPAPAADEARLRSERFVGRWRPARAGDDQVQTARRDGTGVNVDGSRFTWRFQGRHLAVRRAGEPEGSDWLLTIRFSRDANSYELTLQHGDIRVEFHRVGEDGKPVGHKDAAAGGYADEPGLVPPRPAAVREPAGRLAVSVEAGDAPGLRGWAEDVAERMRGWYPRVVEALGSPETPPELEVRLVIKGGDRPDGETQGRTILLSSVWVAAHGDEKDKGIAAHELVHVLQRYGTGAPSWLVEGIPDYIRYFVLEPGTAPRPGPRDADYTGGYAPAACLLDWAERTKGPGVVARLHLSLLAGTYSEAVFAELVGCDPPEAWRRFVASRGAGAGRKD